MLQKLRRAMVAPEREPLKGEVEVDATLVGGHHEGRRGGRQRDGKALVGVVVEVRGSGSGRLRLQVLPDASQATLTAWVKAIVAPGAIVHTDGWKGYEKLAGAGYEHRPLLQRGDHPDQRSCCSGPTGRRPTSDVAAAHPPRRLS
jgi:transposase-like protein